MGFFIHELARAVCIRFIRLITHLKRIRFTAYDLITASLGLAT